MSTTTETEFRGDDVPKGGTAPVEVKPGQDQRQDQRKQQDHEHDHEHGHDHVHEDGKLSPTCTGNGCVQTKP